MSDIEQGNPLGRGPSAQEQAEIITSLIPSERPVEQKITDFIVEENRLAAALDILGMKSDSPKHIRHLLVRHISQFAGVNGDSTLELQCEAMLKSIESE